LRAVDAYIAYNKKNKKPFAGKIFCMIRAF